MRLILVGFLFSGLLMFTGCAHVPDYPGAEKEMVAMEVALKEALKIRQFMRECKNTTSKAGGAMDDMLKQWWAVNGAIVQAADVAYSSKITPIPVDPESRESLLTLRMLYEGEKAGHLLINDRPRSYTQKERKCLQTAKRINERTMDLTRYEKLLGAWEYLVYTHKGYNVEIENIPSAAGSVRLRGNTGRYLYQAQKAVYEECDAASVVLINGEGSTEHYGIFCKKGTNILLQCEWGECQSK